MKKLLFFLLVPILPMHAVNLFVEGKGAYFLPTSGEFKKIYSPNGLYGIELTCQTWRELYVWASTDYFSKTGASCLGYQSKVYFIPIGLGLKYLKLFPIDTKKSVGVYGGVGALATYLHTKEDSPYVVKSTHAWGAGAVLKTGFLFIRAPFFLDLFTNYLFQNFHGSKSSDPKVYSHSTSINGWAFGAGIGFKL